MQAEYQAKSLFQFTIPFVPTKLRPRFNSRVGRAYNPSQNQQQSQNIAHLAKQAMQLASASKQPANTAVKVAITVYKKNRFAKPDVDNIAKSILDALNNIAYEDDKQVTACHITKANNNTQHNNQVIVLVGRAE